MMILTRVAAVCLISTTVVHANLPRDCRDCHGESAHGSSMLVDEKMAVIAFPEVISNGTLPLILEAPSDYQRLPN